MADAVQSDNRLAGTGNVRQRRRWCAGPGFLPGLPLLILGITVIFLVSACWIADVHLAPVYRVVLENSSRPELVQDLLQRQSRELCMLMVLLLAAYAGLVTWVSLWVTHRLAGPTRPILRQLRALRQGQAGARIRLRRNDVWHDVAEELNCLAEMLEQQR